jgi:outer membrane protein TolC
VVSGIAAAAHAEPLSFAQALARADPAAPEVAAGGARIEAAASAARAAGALPDPKAFVGVEDFPVTGPLAGRPGRDSFSMLTVGIEQEVPNRAKRRARSERARADIGVAEAERRLARRDVRVATATAWIDLYYAERRLALLDDLAQALGKALQTAPGQLAAGAVRPAVALEPEQAQAALEDRRAGLVAEAAKARAELRRRVAAAGPVELSGAPQLFTVDPAALRAALDELPDLRVKSAAIIQARADADAARAEKRPDWGYELSYSHRDPRFGDYLSGRVKFSLPLFTATRQQPVIQARLAEVNRGVFEREAARRELAAALEKDLAEHAMHHALLARARGALFPLARRRVELETASYAAGTAALSEVLSAQRALVEVELDTLDREAAVVRDAARIVLTYGSEA